MPLTHAVLGLLYDLAIPRAVFASPRLRPLLEAIHARSVRRAAAALHGYDVSDMGKIVAEIHSDGAGCRPA